MLVVSSGSEEDRVVSVPAEGAVTSSVGSVVHVVRTAHWCRGVGGSVWVTGRRLGVLLQLSGLPRQARHSVHGDGLTREVGEIDVLDRDDEIAGGGGHGGHNHGEGE